MGRSATTDVAIIGAGAAGIAAARRLSETGLTACILEARRRFGGRAWTEKTTLGVALDRGCAWLHDADRNPLRRYAEAYGLGIPSDIPLRSHRAGDFSSATANQELEAYVETQVRELARRARQASDGPSACLVPTEHRDAPILRYILTAIAGVAPEAHALGDAAEEDAFESNWLVAGGMGRLISEDLAAGLVARFATPVHMVDYRRSPIRLRTAHGTLRARAVLSTVPPAVLGAGRPGFRPGLPDWKTQALDAIAMGRAEKVAMRFGGRPFGDDKAHFMAIERSGSWMGFHIEPGSPALATAYTGGELAGEIASMSPEAAIGMAMDHLAHAYGERLRRELVASTVTAWAHDPWSLGSYSAAVPGTHHQRSALAAAVTPRLRFAGEATMSDAFATAHGAWLSGIREADAVAAELAATPVPSAEG